MTPEPDSSADTPLLRPSEAADRIGIPASTLRRWSRRFAAFLSPQANGVREANGTRGHRRYTPADLAVLTRCKVLLSEGYTFEQVAEMLEETFDSEALLVEGEVEEVEENPIQEVSSEERGGEIVREEDAVDLGTMMAQLLSTLSGSQQMLITGQQAERELLSVMIQDNLNLKEENKRLRERMVETERRIFELKREIARHREEERERMRQMESYLFQLQRQMDDLVRSQRQSTFPPALVPFQPTVAASPGPVSVPSPQPVKQGKHSPSPVNHGSPPAAEQSPSSNDESEQVNAPTGISEGANPSPPKRRSFWDWLLGR